MEGAVLGGTQFTHTHAHTHTHTHTHTHMLYIHVYIYMYVYKFFGSKEGKVLGGKKKKDFTKRTNVSQLQTAHLF